MFVIIFDKGYRKSGYRLSVFGYQLQENFVKRKPLN